jgi:PqqD family protein of HPr-rel-A system
LLNSVSGSGGLQVALRAGRALRFSPVWADEGASLAFDRHSGDYWMLPEISRRILLALDGSPGMTLGALMDAVADDASSGPGAEVFPALLDDLAAAGLVSLRGI